MNKLGLALLALLLGAVADAAVLKIATVAPEGSEWMKAMRQGASEIKERTEGRVQIKYYGGGVMGNDSKVLVEEANFVRSRLDDRILAGLENEGFVSFGFAATGFAVIMSNDPVKGLDDLKGKRVWVPEGDTISYASMEALSLSPVTLPLTDVLTGLQTGLIDIVVVSPIGALVLQWHTKVKYVTDIPLVYTMGFMALDKRALRKIDEADQAIVREVMARMYADFDKINIVDNEEALQALLNSGIESVAPDAGEFESIRKVLLKSNRSLAQEGEYSVDLYDEMMQHVEEYRTANGGMAGR